MPVVTFTAKDAAIRYAEDERFAREFDEALAALYKDHIARLGRLAQRLGIQERWPRTNPPNARAAEEREEQIVASRPTLTPDQIMAVLHASANPLTRGEIALRLGIDSRNLVLTRVLRTLKHEQAIRQHGDRKGARYVVAPTEANARTRGRRRAPLSAQPADG